jgi:hypothetical protein
MISLRLIRVLDVLQQSPAFATARYRAGIRT